MEEIAEITLIVIGTLKGLPFKENIVGLMITYRITITKNTKI